MLSSTNGSINCFSHNFYSSSSFNHCPSTTISQESNDMSINYIICPNSPIPNPNIQVPYNQEKADHDLTISQDLHNDPQKRRSARKEYRPKKIYTAQGLRDRRVRLSKEAAHKFFKLQDALGFDKASKTLEWLMNESRKAIEQLGSWRTVSSTRKEEKQSQFLVGDEKERPGLESTVVSKESRAKARARARERTRAKTMSNDKRLVICPEDNCCLLQRDPLKHLPGWSLSQVLEEEEDDGGLLGLDGQNPSVIFEAQEVEEPRSKPPRAGGKTIVHESAFLTSWFTHS